jgi:hypothetical protein
MMVQKPITPKQLHLPFQPATNAGLTEPELRLVVTALAQLLLSAATSRPGGANDE